MTIKLTIKGEEVEMTPEELIDLWNEIGKLAPRTTPMQPGPWAVPTPTPYPVYPQPVQPGPWTNPEVTWEQPTTICGEIAFMQ